MEPQGKALREFILWVAVGYNVAMVANNDLHLFHIIVQQLRISIHLKINEGEIMSLKKHSHIWRVSYLLRNVLQHGCL